MSTTILAVVINLLAVLLPKIGVEIGTEALTTTVATIVQVATGLWIWFRRYQAGGVTLAGIRK